MSVAARETKPAGSLEVGDALGPTPPAYRAPSNPWPRRALWLVGTVVVIVVGLHLSGGFPTKWTLNLAAKFDNMELWVIKNQKKSPLFVNFLNPLQSTAQTSIDSVVTLFNDMTFVGVLFTAVAIAGVAAGWRMAVLTGIGFFGLGLFGLWSESLETLALMLVAVAVALVIGIPLGVLSGLHPGVDRVLRPVLDAMQTVPAFSYLTFLVLFFGIGSPTALIATVVFALPPAVRLTSLGLRGVPLTSLEVADSFGATKRQRLWKVHLPMSKPSIMLGVNQTIMMAMGLIVIAALVGAGGLGQTILDALQNLDIGKALNGGLTIVIMAVVLDRVSYAWGRRGRRTSHVKVGRFSVPRWQVIAGAAVVALIGIMIGRYILVQQDFPASWTISVAKPTNAFADWVTTNMSGFTGWVSRRLTLQALNPLQSLFQNLPWWVVVVGTGIFAWRVSRRVGLVALCVVCLTIIGIVGLWADAMDTLSQVLVAVVISVGLAIPIGVWASQSDRVERVIKPVLDAMQTMPAFVYLVPVVALFQVGRVPGVIASIIYALPPGIRLTNLGIREVPRNTVEAAESFGATRWQMLRKVQLPLARPSILLGANQTIMMVLSVVIIASLIGASGLGHDVLNGLYHEIGQAVVAGIAILMLAIVIDRLTQAMGMSSRSMRGPVGTGGWWTRARALQPGKAKVAVGDVSTQDVSIQDVSAPKDEPGKGDA